MRVVFFVVMTLVHVSVIILLHKLDQNMAGNYAKIS